jgi:hypothetical protein
MYVQERALTFADLSKAVQASAGLSGLGDPCVVGDPDFNMITCNFMQGPLVMSPNPNDTTVTGTDAAAAVGVSTAAAASPFAGLSWLTIAGLVGAGLFAAAVIFPAKR